MEEDKIKCVSSENGTIIPINNIAVISSKDCSHYVWTNRDIDHEGYKLTDEQYNALMNELKNVVIITQETDEWKEGNIIRNGGILALVIKGRRAMRSNGKIYTIQYPNEWVKADPNEIERFLNELENQGEQKLAMNTDKLLRMLLEAIDYSFLQTDGSYNKILTYSVIDKIQYIKEQVKDIEVKEIDLDFEQELYKAFGQIKDFTLGMHIARHFYELGLLSTITEEDCKLIWNIGDDLPHMPEEDFFKELLRRYKEQKGKICINLK